ELPEAERGLVQSVVAGALGGGADGVGLLVEGGGRVPGGPVPATGWPGRRRRSVERVGGGGRVEGAGRRLMRRLLLLLLERLDGVDEGCRHVRRPSPGGRPGRWGGSRCSGPRSGQCSVARRRTRPAPGSRSRAGARTCSRRRSP